MKSTELKATITVNPQAKIIALVLSMLSSTYHSDAQKIIKTVAAHFDMTVSK